MTFKEFVAKYKGQKIDWDKAYDGQCVDLFRQYNHEVLGINQPKGVVGAADFWLAYDTDSVLNTNFEKITNSDTFIPKEGDVAIWNKKMGGGFGHVGVCTGKGDLNTFESFDQNWSKISYCELVTHNYSSFYGVLRPKGDNTSDLQAQFDAQKATLADVTRQRDELDTANKAKDKLITEITGQLNEAKSSSDGFRKQFNDFIAQLANKLGTRQETVEILASVDTCLEYEDKADQLDRQIELERKEHLVAIDTLESKILALESNLEALKADFKALKDTQTTPTQNTNKYSIIEYILNLFKRS